MREREKGTVPVIEIQNKNTVSITNIKVPEGNAGDSRQRVRRFTFDCCFPEDATQNEIFTKVEEVVSKAIKRRYHSCVLAYGQSSTGKTHTMMGFPHAPGLTPRLSEKIFEYLQETAVGNEVENMKTTVSYLEIYNEKVRDLLVSEEGKNFKPLRVREHPKKGPYVQGLTEHEVQDPQELLNWIRLGNENRRVASTLSNPNSSRSHSVVTIACDGVRLYLVDLAGSERAGSKFYTTSRFREGANINRSLVALGNVISALADQPLRGRCSRRRFVPYRDSILTWLLKDTLGGNSNTVMIATISPSSACYSETVNTLRFGQRAKLIVSCPVVNEDPKEKIIRELRTEVAKLRELLKEAQPHPITYMLDQRFPQLQETKDIPSFIVFNDADTETKCSSPFGSENIIDYENQPEVSQDFPVESLEGSDQQSLSQISIDKLIPVMNVQTSISSDKKQIPKFRRTASVDFVGNIMDRSRTPSFGSHESLPITKPPTVGSKILPKSSLASKPLATSRTLSTSNPLIRRRSVDKTTSLKSLWQKRSIPESPKKAEKSIETEASVSKVKSRVDSHRKTVPKPRSDIVANVTRRLYLKAKNKDAGTDMEGFDEPKNEIPKELTICSNARLRLKEITQKALRAHRFRQVETQTDTIVLRVKEVSTDIQDLRLYIPEVRDVETSTPHRETVDVSVGCSLLNNLKNSDSSDYINVTKTCAVQCTEDLLPPKNEDAADATFKREPSPLRVSFTKYLQGQVPPLQPSVECINPSISNPIYANSVNINVSHHYLNGKRISLSNDSLEDENSSNMLLPTPDLISNHNSLDPNIHAMQNEQSGSNQEIKTHFALENSEIEFQVCNEVFEEDKPEQKIAKIYSIANLDDRINSVTLPTCAYLAEICNTEVFHMCSPLRLPQVELAKAIILDCKDSICFETITIYQPTILKSCVKISPNIPLVSGQKQINEDGINVDEEIHDFQEVHDSLDYHKINTAKHVRFSTQKSKTENNLFEAMSNFLEEATLLMSNITKASNNVKMSNSPEMQDFDLQVTLDDVESLQRIFQNKVNKKKRENNSVFQMQTQTDSVPCYDTSSQTYRTEADSHSTQNREFSIPINRYDALVAESCKKLEYKLNSVNRKTTRRSESRFEDNMFPSESSHSYNLSVSGMSDINEDLSLDSNPVTYSDYGSLNRRTSVQKRKPRCSPSAFLKQLTYMRRDVIESSKDDISNGNS